MLIPNYWAEGVAKDSLAGKPVTVRRYGWSLKNQTEASEMAQARADEALSRIVTGEKLRRRELKVPYNGADGLPIREEVIERCSDDAVVTRNSYGARCLNVSSLLIADIDYPLQGGGGGAFLGVLLAMVVGFIAGFLFKGMLWGFALMIVLGGIVLAVTAAVLKQSTKQNTPQQEALARIDAFIAAHKDWLLRIYQTPAGLRVIAAHSTFKADEASVNELFDAIKADPIYAKMCLTQQCFRARLTAKPWRIGVGNTMPTRHGVWPVKAERLHERQAWVKVYETKAKEFAACKYLFNRGSGFVDRTAANLYELHDSLSDALSDKPLA